MALAYFIKCLLLLGYCLGRGFGDIGYLLGDALNLVPYPSHFLADVSDCGFNTGDLLTNGGDGSLNSGNLIGDGADFIAHSGK